MTDAAYDHDRTVTAFFDTRAAAEKAKVDVITAGVPANMVSIIEGNERAVQTTTAGGAKDVGFWDSVKNLFAPEEDKHVYAEGLHRGGFLLTAHTSGSHYDRVLDILDHEGAVDMDEREASWKSEGWSGYHNSKMPVDTAAAASSAATTSRVPHATADAGTPVAERNLAAVGGDTIQLAEEALRVGKRDVNHGRVRLRSYVVEKPVHESINLHSERVDIARRPVDRALSAGENLFQDRTISAEEHSEEVVVSKEARVYEEVSLGKTAQDHTHEINDSVRRTEVEVDDARTGGVAGTVKGGRPGASGTFANIAEHLPVLASEGSQIGTVDHYDGERIKLSKSDSPDGQHHFIPLSWIDHVDTHVHLNKTPADVQSGWTAA